MTKLCFNYESGKYELITEDGFSIDQGQYVYNYDDSEYRREEEYKNQWDYENETNSPWDDEDKW